MRDLESWCFELRCFIFPHVCWTFDLKFSCEVFKFDLGMHIFIFLCPSTPWNLALRFFLEVKACMAFQHCVLPKKKTKRKLLFVLDHSAEEVVLSVLHPSSTYWDKIIFEDSLICTGYFYLRLRFVSVWQVIREIMWCTKSINPTTFWFYWYYKVSISLEITCKAFITWKYCSLSFLMSKISLKK